MKLILSRKGFDSSAGRVPSPILPDGRLISMPIPDGHSCIGYQDIVFNGYPLGPLVDQLTRGRLSPRDRAHIDPDLDHFSLPRLPGWRPMFGQSGSAQSHLSNHLVGPGDLFLFFGLFRQVEATEGGYCWAAGSRPRHVLWGWLQVGDVLPLGDKPPRDYPWAEYHPHFHRPGHVNNVVYLARDQLHLDGKTQNVPGAGIFPCFDPALQLTAPTAKTVSVWQLPNWFYPKQGRTALTYHADTRRWQRANGFTQLQSVARGQEFILDCRQYPEATSWAAQLIGEHLSSQVSTPSMNPS